MRIRCKPTVRFRGFTPALLHILTVLDRYVRLAPLEGGIPGVPAAVTITSGSDSHAVGGHVRAEAVDVRTKDFATGFAKHQFAAALRAALGPDFYVDLEAEGHENEHLHVQLRQGKTYDP